MSRVTDKQGLTDASLETNRTAHLQLAEDFNFWSRIFFCNSGRAQRKKSLRCSTLHAVDILIERVLRLSQRDFLTPLPFLHSLDNKHQLGKTDKPCFLLIPTGNSRPGVRWGFSAPLPKGCEFSSAIFNCPQLLLRLGAP